MIALTRAVSPTLDRCQLTHLERVPVNVDRAADEHRTYERLLERLGCRVERVAPAPDLPDAVFVEDTAVATEELAVLCRPGAASRRREVDGVAETLARYRPLRRLDPPATLDGGDVLRVGRRVWVGLSERTTPEGAEQLRAILGPLGYRVEALPVRGCLHLKSAVTSLGDDAVLLNPGWVDVGAFDGLRVVEVAPGEPRAANVLVAGGAVVMPDAFPRTGERLADLGRTVRTVPLAELSKAEAGVTCCSILLDEPG
jgi:dimethylargininase